MEENSQKYSKTEKLYYTVSQEKHQTHGSNFIKP